MSVTLETAAARRDVASQCDDLGLAEQAAKLRTPSAQNPGLLRPMLLEVRIVATALHASATHLHHGVMASSALDLEKAAAHAIAACDRLLEDRDAANARGPEPGLRPSARPYGGFR